MVLTHSAWAQETVCAVVKIEIAQEMTLERQGFEARMRITNSLDTMPLENVRVEVEFRDEFGDPVRASSDPSAGDARFFVRVDHREGLSALPGGSIAPATAAEIRWLIVPAPGAAEGAPQGKLYFVGAMLDYTVGGKEEQINVAPASIFVRPMPQLTLDYFLPRNVHGDDPFTDVIEAPEPFSLGVRVSNNGQGVARKVKIESAQPRIVENEQGLAIGFELLDGQVNDQPVAPSLLLNFGDIASEQAAVGRWSMITTLSGRFVDFTASFVHADELGGELTSLLEAVNTHWLVGDVLVDLPGRDNVRDFLAEYGDGYRVYESSGADFPVADRSPTAALTFRESIGQDHYYDLLATGGTGLSYLRFTDPSGGQRVIREVIRSDGKRIHPANAWSSRHRPAGVVEWSYHLNLFDADSTGSYTVVLSPAQGVPLPPVIGFIPDRTTAEDGELGFLVQASDPHGQGVSLRAEGLPGTAAFADQGDGTGVFEWYPREGDAGRYDVTFFAANATLESSRTASITVHPWWDPNGEGLDPPGEGDGDGDGDGEPGEGDEQDPQEPVPGVHGEYGVAHAATTWRTLQPRRIFENPVLLLGVPSEHTVGPAALQARPTPDGAFELKLAEWPSEDPEAPEQGAETLPYLILEAGHYHLLDGARWEVGIIDVPLDGVRHEFTFASAFDAPPFLILSPQSAHDDDPPMTLRASGVAADGFRAALMSGAADEGSEAIEGTRKVAYLAIQQDIGEGVLVLDDGARSYELQALAVQAGEYVAAGQTNLRLELPFETASGLAEQLHALTLEGGTFATLITEGAEQAASLRRGYPEGVETGAVGFAAPGYEIALEENQIEVLIERTGEASEPVFVRVQTQSGSAQADEDYTPVDEVLTFRFGERERSVRVFLPEGGDRDITRQFSLVLSAPAGPAELARSSVTVTVRGVAGDGDPGEGEPGDGEPGDGGPGDGEPGDGEPGDGEPGDGGPGDGEPGDGSDGNEPNAPQVHAPADIYLDAIGRITPVNLGEAEATSVDGQILTAVPSATGPFVPGLHEITWRAVDAEGRVGTAIQRIHVRPLANFGIEQWAVQGDSVSVPVYLNGDAPTWPVTLNYAVSGTAQYPVEHNAQAGVLVIEEGETVGWITFEAHPVAESGAPDRTVVFQLVESNNAAIGPIDTQRVRITEQRFTPVVTLRAFQALGPEGSALETRSVLRNGGPVTVRAALTGSTAKRYMLDWSATDNALVNAPDGDAGTFLFHPAGLDAGYYRLRVAVHADGASPSPVTQTLLIQVMDACPHAPETGAGLCPGLHDSQGDGIADHLRIEATPPGTVGIGEGQWLSTLPGLQVRQGETAAAAGHGAATVQLKDLAGAGFGREVAAPLLGRQLALYTRAGHIYDFQITKLPKSGLFVPVVLPLPEGVEVTPNARYATFVEGEGWRFFVRDTRNELHSAVRDAAGECPMAGDPRYVADLVPGAQCLKLTIEDGGPNDASGAANGEITGPGAMFIFRFSRLGNS